MKYTIVAPKFNKPTFDTIKLLVDKCFKKVLNFLEKVNLVNITLKVSISRDGNLYTVKVHVLDYPQLDPYIKFSHKDLRKAISIAANKTKYLLLERH